VNEYPASPPAPEAGAPPPGSVALRLPARHARVTYVILGITILAYLLQLGGDLLLGYDLLAALGAKSNEAIRDGQLWRLITSILLHGAPWHIGFNMYALYSLGNGLERRMGHGRFLLLYLLGGFAGNVFSFLITPAPSYGASTAVFGLIAAEGVFLYQNRRLFGREWRGALNNVGFVILLNLFLGFSSGGLIDNWGHVGGLLGGAVYTWFAGPLWKVEGIYPDLRLVDGREFRDIVLGTGTVVIIFGGLAVWGILFAA
jgi:rhomboid protease GluP